MVPPVSSAWTVDLARLLHAASSLEQTLQRVVEASVDLVDGCQHAGISLATRPGKIVGSVATGDLPRRSDALQRELDEGPCVDAAWRDEFVFVPDVPRASRWPRWTPRAVQELDVGSMISLQLSLGDERLGALNLFAARSHALAETDVATGLIVAAHATVAAVAAARIEGLHTAMHTRSDIGQAMGLLMARYELTSPQSFSLLRRLSNEQNRKISTLANELVEQHEDALVTGEKE